VATDEANPICAFFFLHSKTSLSVIKDWTTINQAKPRQ
jgi:hypothetical protein